MNQAASKKVLPKLTTFLFWFSVVAMILFNTYAAIGKWSIGQTIERTQTEIDTRREQTKELQTLKSQYYNKSISEFEELEARVLHLRKQFRNHDKLFPSLDHEFVVTNVDTYNANSERAIYLTAPAIGTHRLRIQATYRNESLLDRQFNLVSGNGYQIRFIHSDGELRLAFPGEETVVIPVSIELDDFAFSNRISSLRTSLAGRQIFTSCNQPRWTLESSFKTREYGVLAQFAFMSNRLEPEEHLSIKITSESDGPPTAAADDIATVLHLGPLLGLGFKPEYRFENGRYIFETTVPANGVSEPESESGT